MSKSTPYAIGLDTSDREIHVALLDPDGTVLQETTVPLDRSVLSVYFRTLQELEPVIALETGTHANWIYDLLVDLEYPTVLVADARQVALISKSNKKTDRVDARKLARLAQSCPELLHPVKPRTEGARQDRRLLSGRQALVETRTKLIAQVRGLVKSTGSRLAACDTSRFHDFEDSVPESLKLILSPTMDVIRTLNKSIQTYDSMIHQRCEGDPIIQRLMQVNCVGEVTSLAFVAAVEDPSRFARNRDVGPFLGITPKIDDSGTIQKQLHITKAGDSYVRQLLVICAQGILRKSSPVTDLKRWGQSIAESGGKRGKRRAAVAVARKLAVVLLALWRSGQDYEPLRNQRPSQTPKNPTTGAAQTKRVRATAAKTAQSLKQAA